MFDAFAILGFVSQGGDHEIPGSLSHLFQRLDEPAVQVDAVANADSPPGDPAEVGTVVVAGKDGPIVAYGPRVGPWFECRGIGISITSLETDDRVGYAIETAMSIAAELNCAN